MPKETFYAVSVGQQPGIYTDFNEAKTQTRGIRNGRYKKFKSKDSAEQFLEKAGVLPPKERFYAVANGRKTGLFQNSAEANEQIHRFPHFLMKKFFSRNEAVEFLESHGRSVEIKDNDESHPLAKKTLAKLEKNFAKQRREMYESLGIDSDDVDEDESDDDDEDPYFILGLMARALAFGAQIGVDLDDESSDESPDDVNTGRNNLSVYNHDVPYELQCEICTYNRRKALGLVRGTDDDDDEGGYGTMEYCTETGGYHCACRANCPRIIDFGMDIEL